MIVQAGDIGVQIDTGLNQPGGILHRLEGAEWKPVLKEGRIVRWPVNLESLRPGRYMVRVIQKG